MGELIRCYVCDGPIDARDLFGYVEEVGRGDGPTSSSPPPSRFRHVLCTDQMKARMAAVVEGQQ